jgi:hypothetical protein
VTCTICTLPLSGRFATRQDGAKAHTSCATVVVRNAARCRKCGTVVESAHRHDWRSCPCGAVFVDGGTAYLRRGFTHQDDLEELSETRLRDGWTQAVADAVG